MGIQLKYILSLLIAAALVWLFSDSVLCVSPGAVQGWLGLLPQNAREYYVFKVLESSDQREYKKATLLEAWLIAIDNNEATFAGFDVKKLVPISHYGEALGEPVGSLAANVIIKSKDCNAYLLLLDRYKSDVRIIAAIKEREKLLHSSCADQEK